MPATPSTCISYLQFLVEWHPMTWQATSARPSALTRRHRRSGWCRRRCARRRWRRRRRRARRLGHGHAPLPSRVPPVLEAAVAAEAAVVTEMAAVVAAIAAAAAATQATGEAAVTAAAGTEHHSPPSSPHPPATPPPPCFARRSLLRLPRHPAWRRHRRAWRASRAG